jgi:uncharacterized protein YneF (UPF0154 family)
VLIQLVLRLVKTLIVLVIIVYFIALFIGTIIGNYGFNRVFEDYRYMIYSMQDNPNPQDIIISKLLPFPNKSKISKAVNFSNSNVRNFALYATTKHLKKSTVDGIMLTIPKEANTLHLHRKAYNIFRVIATIMPFLWPLV